MQQMARPLTEELPASSSSGDETIILAGKEEEGGARGAVLGADLSGARTSSPELCLFRKTLRHFKSCSSVYLYIIRRFKQSCVCVCVRAVYRYMYI